MRAAFRAFLANRSANAATEFAFILPIMLFFVGGIVEFGRFFVASNEINRLAARYAITYSDCLDSPTGTTSPCNTELQSMFMSTTALRNLAPQLSPTAPLTVRVFQVEMSTSNVPTVDYPTGSPNLSGPEITAAQSSIGPTQSGGPTQYGIVVTISYTHSLLFFSSIMNQFIPSSMLTFSYTVAQRKN